MFTQGLNTYKLNDNDDQLSQNLVSQLATSVVF